MTVVSGGISENTFGDSWNQKPIVPKTEAKALSQLDIAQSHFFKIEISGLEHRLMQHYYKETLYNNDVLVSNQIAGKYRTDELGNKVLAYKNRELLNGNTKKSKESGYGKFLPIKNVNLTTSGIDVLRLNLGIFSNFPIAQRKKISTLNITMYDTDDDYYEQQLRAWYQQTIPDNSGYVGYMTEIIRLLTFTSYNTKGEKNFVRRNWVMLTDDLKINRDYDSNAFKEISFDLAIVGTMD